jgi:hypothetical protein
MDRSFTPSLGSLPEREPPLVEELDPETPQLSVIGEFWQTIGELVPDGQGREIAIEAGLYPFVAALNGRVLGDGGIVFHGSDRETGERHSLVQFHSARETRELSQAGRLQVKPEYVRSLSVDEKALKPETPAEKPRLGMRR